MRMMFRNIALAAAAALMLASCSAIQPEPPAPYRVTIMYAAAMSNLSPSIYQDVEEISNGMLPSKQSGDIFLVYSHFPVKYGYYDLPSAPVLFRAWRDPDGTSHRDTLITYPTTDISSSAPVMNKVLSDVRELFPAPHYALIISSHGKGWIPTDYQEDNSYYFSPSPGQQEEAVPFTRELCIEMVPGSGINVDDLPSAIPMKMDYIVLDACLMGTIETAYELRDKCDLLLFSPTEVLTDGLMYDTMAPLITNIHTPDVKSVAKQYFDHYNSMYGSYRSATITLVDCKALEPLSQVCRTLISKHSAAIRALDPDTVQHYFYNTLHWFFDMRDIFQQAGVPEAEMAQLDAALSDAVIYEAHTDQFLGLQLKRVCGLSMYLPYPKLTELNQYYRGLAWNKATGLID